MATGNLWFGGVGTFQIFELDGFSNTLLDSFGAYGLTPGIAGDSGDNCLEFYSAPLDRVFKHSGFSATVDDSLIIQSVVTIPAGGTSDSVNLIAADEFDDETYKFDGFSITILDSISTAPAGFGATWTHNDDLLTSDISTKKAYEHAGFSSTIDDSFNWSAEIPSPDLIPDMTWDGEDLIVSTSTAGKIFKFTGFSDTVADSFSTLLIDYRPEGVGHSDIAERLGGGGMASNETIESVRTRVSGGGVRTPHDPHSRQVGHPSKFASPTSSSPEVAGWAFRHLVTPGYRSRHPSIAITTAASMFYTAPPPAGFIHHYLDLRGRYRIFNASAYRFYRSNSAPPVESDTPYATSSSLPNTPADLFADGTWWISASYFNGVLDSGFLPLGTAGETYLRIDIAAAAVVGSPPAGPGDWRIEARPGGVIRVVAFYLQADANRADFWSIVNTSDGTTPVEDGDAISVAIPATGLAVLSYDLPPGPHGSTYKVRLQTKRGSIFSEGSTIKIAIADHQGPGQPVTLEAWRGRVPENLS